MRVGRASNTAVRKRVHASTCEANWQLAEPAVSTVPITSSGNATSVASAWLMIRAFVCAIGWRCSGRF